MDVNIMIQAGESTHDIAPLFFYRVVWLCMESSGRSKYCVIGNSCTETFTGER